MAQASRLSASCTSPKFLAAYGPSGGCLSDSSLGLPERAWASRQPELAIEHLKTAIGKTAEMGCLALSGVTYGGIGERTGMPPTQKEYDNVARALTAAAKHAKTRGILFGIEPVNRYENHLINSGWQAVEMIERIGAENMFIHLDTYHTSGL